MSFNFLFETPLNEDWEHPDFTYLYSDLDSED